MSTPPFERAREFSTKLRNGGAALPLADAAAYFEGGEHADMADALELVEAGYKPFVPTSSTDLIAKLDETVTSARTALAAASDANLMKPWSLRNGETIFFTMPKVAVLRTFVMNHMIHHRAQLGVYLRLNDVPVPSTYGPSADEGQM